MRWSYGSYDNLMQLSNTALHQGYFWFLWMEVYKSAAGFNLQFMQSYFKRFIQSKTWQLRNTSVHQCIGNGEKALLCLGARFYAIGGGLSKQLS